MKSICVILYLLFIYLFIYVSPLLPFRNSLLKAVLVFTFKGLFLLCNFHI